MINKHFSLIVAVLLVFGIIGTAKADELKCNNCSEASYKALAKSELWGTHYVYDLVNGNVRKYDVESEPNEFGGYMTFAYQRSVESDLVTVTQELSAYYIATAGSMTSHFEFNTDGSVSGLSAFDVAGPGGPRTQLLDWLSSSKSYTIKNALPMEGAIIHNMLIAAVNIFKREMSGTIVIIRFIDGSKISLEFDSLNGTSKVIEGTAVDKYGNVIISKIEDLNGARFDYGQDPGGPDETRMKDYLSFYGVKVTGSTRWACAYVGTGWSCTTY